MKFARVVTFVFVVMSVTSAIAQDQPSDRDRGIDLYREGKFTEAITVLEAAVAANETDRAACTSAVRTRTRNRTTKRERPSDG